MATIEQVENWSYEFGWIQGVLLGLAAEARGPHEKAIAERAEARLKRLGDQALDLRRDWLRLKADAGETLDCPARHEKERAHA